MVEPECFQPGKDIPSTLLISPGPRPVMVRLCLGRDMPAGPTDPWISTRGAPVEGRRCRNGMRNCSDAMVAESSCNRSAGSAPYMWQGGCRAHRRRRDPSQTVSLFLSVSWSFRVSEMMFKAQKLSERGKAKWGRRRCRSNSGAAVEQDDA